MAAASSFGFGVTSYDYELNSHTRGLAFSFADQINSQPLLTFDANYTTATTNRYNNTNFNNTPLTIADEPHERGAVLRLENRPRFPEGKSIRPGSRPRATAR